MDTYKKWLNWGLGVLALLFGLTLWVALSTLWFRFRLPVLSSFPIPLPAILAFILALGILLFLKKQPRVNEFGLEVISELAKVSWPDKKETMIATGVIIVMIGIASLLLFLMDTLWGTLAKSFLEL